MGKKIKILLTYFMIILILSSPGYVFAAGLSAPTFLEAVAVSSTEVKLSWPEVMDASAYNIYASEGSGWYKVDTVTELEYSHTGLTKSFYAYKVTAIISSEEGEGAYQGVYLPEKQIPLPVNNLRAIAVSSHEIDLTWDPDPNSTFYNIFAGNGGSNYTFLTSVTEPQFAHKDLSNSLYTYKVVAVNEIGESEGRYTAAYTLELPTPVAPENLVATAISSTQIDLSWDSVLNSKGYFIYRSSAESEPYSRVGTSIEPSFSDLRVSDARTYWYKVSALTDDGEGPLSNPANAQTPNNFTEPPIVTNDPPVEPPVDITVDPPVDIPADPSIDIPDDSDSTNPPVVPPADPIETEVPIEQPVVETPPVDSDSPPIVILNGNQLHFDVQPIIVSGRTLVPLRIIFESLGSSVDWDNDTQTVTAYKNGMTISLQIGSYWAYKNDEAVELDVPSQLIYGRTLVPLRFVSESLGADVSWDNYTRTVTISD